MGFDFGKLINDAAKGVSDFFEQAGKDITKAIDQNGDGKLDLADLQALSSNIQANQERARRQADIDRLKPLFKETFKQPDFVMPKMICVDDIDKAHAESDVCKDSVGFKAVLNNVDVITLYSNQIDQFGLTFYPGPDNGVYYVDPCDKNHYILLEEYFSYMKKQLVAELNRIAQSLGAKHFITLAIKTRQFWRSVL